MTANHRVTPSEAVDRAWLLHLTDAVYVLGVWSGEQSGTDVAAVITVAVPVVLGALVSFSPAARERIERNRVARRQRAYLGMEGTFEGTMDTSRDSEAGGDWSGD